MPPFAKDLQNDICLFLLTYKHMENKIQKYKQVLGHGNPCREKQSDI